MDLITYALCKKIANGAASGIADVRIEGLNLILITNDGTELVMTFPTPKDGISVTNLDIDESNHLITLLSDGTSIDAGPISTVKGDKGEQGISGYSPTISVKENTESSYILTIQNETTSYDTPNLKGASSSFEVLEGTYDSPIDLSSLDYNIYYIKGYFQKNASSNLEQRKKITSFTVTEDDVTYNKTITYNVVENGIPTVIAIIYNTDKTYTEIKYPLTASESTWGTIEDGVGNSDIFWGTLQ